MPNNDDDADDELSVLGYLSNSLPRTSSPLIFALRRFIDTMGMISVPMRAERYAMIRSHLRPLVRDMELVREFERFTTASRRGASQIPISCPSWPRPGIAPRCTRIRH